MTEPVWDAEPAAAVESARWGLELALFVERFRLTVFVGGLRTVAALSFGSAVLLPGRQDVSGSSLIIGLMLALGLAAGASLAGRRTVAARVFRALRKLPWLRIAVVVLAVALVSALQPLRSQLWVPSCGLIAVLAIVVPVGEALAACLVVLLANLLAHLIAGDLSEIAPVTVVGLWVGYPFWTTLVGVGTNHCARHLARTYIERTRPVSPPRPLRVRSVDLDDPLPRAMRYDDGRVIPDLDVLDARDIEILALLIAGRERAEIGEDLSITVSTVTNRLTAMVQATGTVSKYALARHAARAWRSPVNPSD